MCVFISICMCGGVYGCESVYVCVNSMFVGEWLYGCVCVSVYVCKCVYVYETYMEIAQKLYKNDFIFSLNVSLSKVIMIFVPHHFFAKKLRTLKKISQTGYLNGHKGIFQHENMK